MAKYFKVTITMGLHVSGTEIVTENQMITLKMYLQQTPYSQLAFWEFDSGQMINLALVQTIKFMEIEDDK